MKRKLVLKNHSKKKINIRFFIFFFIFVLSISITFNYLLHKNININSKVLVKYLLKDSNGLINTDISNKININVVNLLNLGYLSSKKLEVKENTSSNKPLIYLYNTHQTEEYTSCNPDSYGINPTVTINNYIMKDIFDKNRQYTLTEERSIKDILNINSWSYSSSYKASRIYLEDVKKTYPSLKYFIDIHRDSLRKDKTSITIDNKKYAKVLFIVGLENPSYQDNLSFTESINNKIIEKYPTLSKGIYKKKGVGVNGIYNQDFSKYTILIEVGGVDNTVEEVMNTTIIISNIISEVIKVNET